MRSKFDFPSNLIKLVVGPAAPVPLSLLLHHSYSESVLYFARRVDTGPGWAGIKMMDICITHGDGGQGTRPGLQIQRGNLVNFASDMILKYLRITSD